jgi:hypothetical protein
MEFFNFSPDLKMRAYSGVVFVKYHRHLKALRRQDILQVSQIQLMVTYVGGI